MNQAADMIIAYLFFNPLIIRTVTVDEFTRHAYLNKLGNFISQR